MSSGLNIAPQSIPHKLEGLAVRASYARPMVVFELPCPNSRAGDSPVMAPSGAFFPLCDVSASGMRPLKLASQPRPCLIDIWQCALFRQQNLSLGRLSVIVFARAIKCMMRGGCCDNASAYPQDDLPDFPKLACHSYGAWEFLDTGPSCSLP